MLQCIFPQLYSSLLECSLRALAYTLSVTKHLEKLQSMHLHAHRHVIFLWKPTPFSLPFPLLPFFLHPFGLQPPGDRAQTFDLTTCAVPSSKDAEYTVKNKKGTQHTHTFHLLYEKESTFSCVTCPYLRNLFSSGSHYGFNETMQAYLK